MALAQKLRRRNRRSKRRGNSNAREFVLYYRGGRVADTAEDEEESSPVLVRRDEVPEKPPDMLRMLLVSDTHGQEREFGTLPQADVFIHAGDILVGSKSESARDNQEALKRFNEWLGAIDAPQKFVVGGNHDNFLEQVGREQAQSLLSNCTYLEYTGARCRLPDLDVGRDLVIYGVPFSEGTSWNDGYRYSCPDADALRASATLEQELGGGGIDILVTHGPSPHIAGALRPSLLHVHGHIHKGHGIYFPGDFGVPVWGGKPTRVECLTVCASLLDNSYDPNFEPVLMDIPVHTAETD